MKAAPTGLRVVKKSEVTCCSACSEADPASIPEETVGTPDVKYADSENTEEDLDGASDVLIDGRNPVAVGGAV